MKKLGLLCALLLSATVHAGSDHAHPPQNHSALDPLKQLAGTWEMSDKDGKSQGVSSFAVSSGGSVVREVLFPGSDHEMTNMYHLDGDSVVMTHYCAGGNQPRMRAKPDQTTLDFKFESVTNLRNKGDSHMGEMKLTLKDKDHAVQEWTTIEGDKKTRWAFHMTRKKV